MSLIQITTLPAFPKRPAAGHKGTFGRVLLLAGSWGMTGAAVLAGRAALRGGAGLVYVAAPRSCVPVIASGEPAYLTLPLPEDHSGQTTTEALELLQEHAQRMDALAIGPGLGRSAALDHIVTTLYGSCALPCVVDADALNVLAAQPALLSGHVAARILTPHVGEFSRLTGLSPEQISTHRVEHAAAFAAQQQVILVLKGPGTVVTDGTSCFINTTGNAGMATGGTGDVLTGLILALLGQGCRPFEAAQLGVYLHGLAGDCAAEQWTQPGLIASDLPDYLPQAIATLL